MKQNNYFKNVVWKIALPITLQSVFQASFSVIDQIMTGQLGTVSVAGIGLGGKFTSIYSVLVSAVATAAGILIAQHVGRKDEEGIRVNFWTNMIIISILAVIFTVISGMYSVSIMGIYSRDRDTIEAAAGYLRILSFGFLPMAVSQMVSTLLRCKGYASLPLKASVVSAVMNTVLNYILIFGKCGFPALGIMGAAIATSFARLGEVVVLLGIIAFQKDKIGIHIKPRFSNDITYYQKLVIILLPIIGNELLWSLGENVYAIIYGRIGTKECAAMTLTNPIQSLMIGAMTGIASAAGILIGKRLGEGKYDKAYEESKKMMWYGLLGAVSLSVLLVLVRNAYVQIYAVELEVQQLTSYILVAYALIAPFKVENMIVSGGIIRSGGKTKYVLLIDLIGTWCIGVPIGIVCGIFLNLPIYIVYFALSCEEMVRFMISLAIFTRKRWMQNLTESM